jgi:hypothetical protein
MASFMQYATTGGHQIRGEADLADGHARFLLIFEDVINEDGTLVGSRLTGAEVYLNNCRIRNTELADRLYHEAREQR